MFKNDNDYILKSEQHKTFAVAGFVQSVTLCHNQPRADFQHNSNIRQDFTALRSGTVAWRGWTGSSFSQTGVTPWETAESRLTGLRDVRYRHFWRCPACFLQQQQDQALDYFQHRGQSVSAGNSQGSDHQSPSLLQTQRSDLVCQEAIWEAFRIFFDRVPNSEEYMAWVYTCQHENLCLDDLARNFSSSPEHLDMVASRVAELGESEGDLPETPEPDRDCPWTPQSSIPPTEPAVMYHIFAKIPGFKEIQVLGFRAEDLSVRYAVLFNGDTELSDQPEGYHLTDVETQKDVNTPKLQNIIIKALKQEHSLPLDLNSLNFDAVYAVGQDHQNKMAHTVAPPVDESSTAAMDASKLLEDLNLSTESVTHTAMPFNPDILTDNTVIGPEQTPALSAEEAVTHMEELIITEGQTDQPFVLITEPEAVVSSGSDDAPSQVKESQNIDPTELTLQNHEEESITMETSALAEEEQTSAERGEAPTAESSLSVAGSKSTQEEESVSSENTSTESDLVSSKSTPTEGESGLSEDTHTGEGITSSESTLTHGDIVSPERTSIGKDSGLSESIRPEEDSGLFSEKTQTEVDSMSSGSTHTEEESVSPEITHTEEESVSPEITHTEEESVSPEITHTEEESVSPEITHTEEESVSPESTHIEEESVSPEITHTEEESVSPESTHTEEEIVSPESTHTEEEIVSPESTHTEVESVSPESTHTEEESVSQRSPTQRWRVCPLSSPTQRGEVCPQRPPTLRRRVCPLKAPTQRKRVGVGSLLTQACMSGLQLRP
ncbi:hypothetical protein WMY93_017546 [Mugilogobius chulae]|uniref:Interphotoreceptor matrix proteoglycan 2-like n=1 Tax=Mugilogobius chulae TaxID=88201 RepID=A0AAW0P0P4_9GOBI